MNNSPSLWVSPTGELISEDQLLDRLYSDGHRTGLVVLDGVTGCGKTRVLHRLKQRHPDSVFILSKEAFTEELIRACKPGGNANARMESLLGLCGDVICLEDVDLFCGKLATMESVADITRAVAAKSVVIMTGNHLTRKVPFLLDHLEGSEKYTFSCQRSITDCTQASTDKR